MNCLELFSFLCPDISLLMKREENKMDASTIHYKSSGTKSNGLNYLSPNPHNPVRINTIERICIPLTDTATFVHTWPSVTCIYISKVSILDT